MSSTVMNSTTIQPRDYQIELYLQAIQENVIICAETGYYFIIFYLLISRNWKNFDCKVSD